MYRIYEIFAHFKINHRYSRGITPRPIHVFSKWHLTCDTASLHHYSALIMYGHMFFQEKNYYIKKKGLWRCCGVRRCDVSCRHQAAAAATEVGLFKRRCVWRASHSFISVHVGKKWWTTATAAIVLCYSQTPVITVRFCTFIQFWYSTAFFGEMSCVLLDM